LAVIRNQFALSALVLALAASGVAQTEGASNPKISRDGSCWVEETTGTLPASRFIKIHTNAGNVSVTGSQQSNITYSIRKRVSASSEEGARRAFDNQRISAAKALVTGIAVRWSSSLPLHATWKSSKRKPMAATCSSRT
jgi:hypothetical protein